MICIELSIEHVPSSIHGSEVTTNRHLESIEQIRCFKSWQPALKYKHYWHTMKQTNRQNAKEYDLITILMCSDRIPWFSRCCHRTPPTTKSKHNKCCLCACISPVIITKKIKMKSIGACLICIKCIVCFIIISIITAN